MTTSTPTPAAVLAAEIKRLAERLYWSTGDGDKRAGKYFPDCQCTLHAAIDRLREMAEGAQEVFFNGLTEQEADASASVRGLSASAATTINGAPVDVTTETYRRMNARSPAKAAPVAWYTNDHGAPAVSLTREGLGIIGQRYAVPLYPAPAAVAPDGWVPGAGSVVREGEELQAAEDALRFAMALCDAVPNRVHQEKHKEHPLHWFGVQVNELGGYHLVRAALKALVEYRTPPASTDRAVGAEGRVALTDDCRIELVTAVHVLASHYENRLHRLDPEDRRLAEGDIAHARKTASRWNWNGTTPPSGATSAE